jgi:hypothetical protein
MVTYVIISDKFKAGLSSSTSTCKTCRVAQMLGLNLGSGNNSYIDGQNKFHLFFFFLSYMHLPVATTSRITLQRL